MNQLVENQVKDIVPETATVFTPDTFIDKAITSGAPVETLNQLFELKERHDASEAKKAFYRAMQKFQSIKPELKKSSKVAFNQTEYKFCNLSNMEKALKEPLEECDLSFRYENGESEGKFSVTCIVSHVQGHSERTTMSAPMDDSGNKNKIQAIGSTSTYLMRYTLVAAFGLTTADEDDDGQSSSDMPFQKVLTQNEALRDIETLKVVLAAKEALAEGDFYEVCTYLYEMPQETLHSLWVAPTKGGIFTTEERAKIKSDDFVSVRLDYMAKREEGAENEN